ncbi:MAG: methyl-accepting chemotaxis protein [Azoarcus sp.]|jgi:methyl-accepting chemotaxis protein|nr:methyl-accepting chemotaxis protein [Azoarcus sp.]
MFHSLKIGQRLLILTAVSLILAVIIAGVGIVGMTVIQTDLRISYNQATKPLQSLAQANGKARDVAANVLLAFHHAPDSSLAKSHGDEIENHLEKAAALMKTLEEHWGAFRETELGVREAELVKGFDEHYALFKSAIERTVTALRRSDFSESNASRFLTHYAAHVPPLEKTLTALIGSAEELAHDKFLDGRKSVNANRMTIAGTLVGGLALCVTLALLLIKSITQPLSEVQRAMTEIETTRNFTHRVPVASQDEVGQAAQAFNLLLASLQKIFKDILGNTDQLMQIAAELSEHTQQAAHNSESASESTAAMAAAVEEMSVSITHVSDNAKDTLDVSRRTGELSQQGSDVIRDTVARMRAMADSVQNSSVTIAELGKQSTQISSIVQVIKDVADQTNLLALNAAIEAARAGEQGRGFAVVADEVRKLAERTASATGEIASMISAIQESSHSAVHAMSNAAEQVEQSVNLADRAGSAIADIQHGADEVRSHVNDITSALTEQGIASQNIAQQVERVARAAEENSVKAKGAAEAVTKIKVMAQGVRTEIGQFTL